LKILDSLSKFTQHIGLFLDLFAAFFDLIHHRFRLEVLFVSAASFHNLSLIDVSFLKSSNKEIKKMNIGKVGAPFHYSNSYVTFLACFSKDWF